MRATGATILVPAMAYYEVLREIERRTAINQRHRLKQYCFQPDRFMPLTTAQLDLAAGSGDRLAALASLRLTMPLWMPT